MCLVILPLIRQLVSIDLYLVIIGQKEIFGWSRQWHLGLGYVSTYGIEKDVNTT